jgi:hypothetical protein
MPKQQQLLIKSIPDFDVICEDIDTCATILMERLEQNGYKNIQKITHVAIGEVVPESVEIRVGKDTLVFIYKPIACHNYNKIQLGKNEIKVATIDTILSFYYVYDKILI